MELALLNDVALVDTALVSEVELVKAIVSVVEFEVNKLLILDSASEVV